MSVKVRVVKVIVQPILVADDGETLRELPIQPIEVSAKDWPAYPAEQFAEALVEMEANLNAP
jgi:hypothetical protein